MKIEKVIDGHLHIEAFSGEEGYFIDSFEKYRDDIGIRSYNICAIPHIKSGPDSISSAANNIQCAFYKIAHPDVFAHACLEHFGVVIPEKLEEGFDYVTQYKELMEIGFDGIKMLEGKPDYHKRIGKNLLHPELMRFYSEVEKNKTHLVFHVNDPIEFWDPALATPDRIKIGWYYGDGSFATHEELYRQAEAILEKNPNIAITFAHFYFCGEKPEKLQALFDKYPNLNVDITPGTEMYFSFENNHDFYREFFIKNSNRISVGTDGTHPWPARFPIWCMDRLYRFITTDEVNPTFDDKPLTGLKLPDEAAENILYKNFERRVSVNPKPINKAALKAYIDKYLPTITAENTVQEIKKLAQKYLD
ncbi:MAG: amidohydrolase family protein [Kiritimatiellae bacterium]|nr:amidohydrolase family protein [Kiritimatiellia bacterium]